MQKDIVLRVPKCSLQEIRACDDPLSNHKVMKEKGSFLDFVTVEENGEKRKQHICEVAVPGACPRIQCFNEETNKFKACRLLGLIQAQENESGFWMKLPCSKCHETTHLHPVTEGFVYGEDEKSNN